MRRILVVLAAACLLLPLAAAHANIVRGGSASGDPGRGGYKDLSYHNSEVAVTWIRNSQTDHHGGYIVGYIENHALPDYQGRNTCAQVFLDWDTPDGAWRDHYDGRLLRNCQPNTIHWISGVDGFIEPDDACAVPSGSFPPSFIPGECDMPMGRVQIARYVPSLDRVVDDSKECWYREAGHTLSDCESWETLCPPDKWACRGWIRQRDGDAVVRDGGCSSCPNDRVRRPRR